MKKNIYTNIIVFLIFVLLVPSFAMARLVAISDEAMDSINGQSGIQIAFKDTHIKMSSDTIYYGDDDGINGKGPAYLSLCDFSMDAEIHAKSPIKLDIGTVEDPFNRGTRIQAVMMKISDLTMDIHNLRIGAIRVGSQIGQGKSFGSFGIQHMHTEITGNIMVWAH